MSHLSVVKTRRRLSSETRYLRRGLVERGGSAGREQRRQIQAGLKIFHSGFFFPPNWPAKKYSVGAEKRSVPKPFLCRDVFKSVIKMIVHLDKWLFSTAVERVFTPFAAGFLPAVRQVGHQNIKPTGLSRSLQLVT